MKITLFARVFPFLALALPTSIFFAGEVHGAVGPWGSNKIWGLNYDPQLRPGDGVHDCGYNEQSIESDLWKIKAVTGRFRTYSLLGCDVGRIYLEKADKVGLKVWLGMWVGKDNGAHIRREIAELSRLLSDPRLRDIYSRTVEGVIVGSEVLFREDATPEQLTQYVKELRAVAREKGVSVTVANADVITTDSVIQAVDVVMQNNFPFWAGYSIDGAVESLPTLIRETRERAQRYGKTYIIGETGWPSRGNPMKPSTPGNKPGMASQNRYLNELTCLLNQKQIPFLYFQAFDMAFDKTNNPNGIGVDQHWGIYNAQRTAMNSWIQIPTTCATRTPAPACTIEDGYDYIGNDLAEVPGGSAEVCCGLCQARQGCEAFVWSTYNSGTCFLKSAAVEPPADKPFNYMLRRGKISARCPPLEDNLDIVGGDVGSVNGVKDAAECCAHCNRFAGCKVFTWSDFEGGTCWLKSGRGQTAFKAGVKSGGRVLSPSAGVCNSAVKPLAGDFSGNDVGSAKSSSAEGCCAVCTSRSDCFAYTWTSYEGGTCWLKSAPTLTRQNPSGDALSAPVCPGGVEEGVDFVGQDIGSRGGVPVAEYCCGLCNKTPGCRAFTWLSGYQGGTCFFKSGASQRAANAQCRSAVVKR